MTSTITAIAPELSVLIKTTLLLRCGPQTQLSQHTVLLPLALVWLSRPGARAGSAPLCGPHMDPSPHLQGKVPSSPGDIVRE